MKVASVLVVLLIAPFLIYSQQINFKSYNQELRNVGKGIDMIAVPGGIFKTGIVKNEQPKQVKVDGFWIGKYEISWDLYELFVYESGDVTTQGKNDGKVDAVSRPSPPYLDMTFGMGKTGFPAVGMTQYNAIQFCKWLYLRTGVFYRIPTEAEWEYACRAGTESTYFFGDNDTDLKNYAWYSENSTGKTQPIGTKQPNGWGIYDMYGNVAEWTYDQFIPDFYESSDGKLMNNPVAIPEKLYPISVRGGSFKDPAANLTSASRSGSDPSWKAMDPQIPKSNWWFPDAPFIGVRIVRPGVSPAKKEIESYYNRKPIPDY